jgi:hypothetical protein
MAVIELCRLSLPDAEEAITEVWSCLEEYGIPSPTLRVDFHANARVSMGFTFDEPIGAHLVSLRLSNWVPSSVERDRPDATIAQEYPLRSEKATISLGSEVAAALPLRAAAPMALLEPFRRAKRR